MTTNVWHAIVAISALGLVAASIPGPTRDLDASALHVEGGPPDTLVADPAASAIRWKGTKFGGRGSHEGHVRLSSGMFVIRHERLTSGTFTIDMKSLDVTDIPASDSVPRRRLRDHFQNADFFDVERHPTAVFSSTGATRIGPTRWRVAGGLTMRGVTKPITFDADVQWPELGHMVAISTFTIDRQQWGVAYRGSRLANDLVDDEMQISLKLDARRKQAKVATR